MAPERARNWLALLAIALSLPGAGLCAAAGAIAAVVLEAQLWPEADVPLERGVFALPYLAWLACGAWSRRGREDAPSA